MDVFRRLFCVVPSCIEALRRAECSQTYQIPEQLKKPRIYEAVKVLKVTIIFLFTTYYLYRSSTMMWTLPHLSCKINEVGYLYTLFHYLCLSLKVWVDKHRLICSCDKMDLIFMQL